jgi:Protein of unknown function (DUF3617)
LLSGQFINTHEMEINMFAKTLFTFALVLPVSAQVVAQSALPGRWEVTTTMEGVPSADNRFVQSACVDAKQIANSFEQAILDISASGGGASTSGPPKSGPKCVIADVKRDGSGSSWQATCEGPRGELKGTGSATGQANRATLTQNFVMKMPLIGALKLKQSVEATRLGECQ